MRTSDIKKSHLNKIEGELTWSTFDSLLVWQALQEAMIADSTQTLVSGVTSDILMIKWNTTSLEILEKIRSGCNSSSLMTDLDRTNSRQNGPNISPRLKFQKVIKGALTTPKIMTADRAEGPTGRTKLIFSLKLQPESMIWQRRIEKSTSLTKRWQSLRNKTVKSSTWMGN